MNEKLDQLSNETKNFLIRSRKNAGLSQMDVANRSGAFGIEGNLDQKTVCRIEQLPFSVDPVKMAAYLNAVGIPFSQYYEWLNALAYEENDQVLIKNWNTERPKPITLLLKRIESVEQQLQPELDKFKKPNYLSYFESFLFCQNYFYQIKGGLENSKPIIGFFGHSDAGKSTLINTLIGKDVLPTRYQPTTSILHLMIHIEDKPSHIVGTVSLFKKGFRPSMVYEQSLFKNFLIETGDESILERLGTHNGNESSKEDYIAVIFAQADILQHAWLLDTPGDFMHNENDAEIALSSLNFVDGVVFVSPHANFLKKNDLGFASQILRNRLPSCDNDAMERILLIQSHCYSLIKVEDINTATVNAIKRISMLNTNLPSEFTSRVQPFWQANSQRRNETISSIVKMAKYLNSHHDAMLIANGQEWLAHITSLFSKTADVFEKYALDTEAFKNTIHALEANFQIKSPSIVNEFNHTVGSLCHKRKIADISSMLSFYKKTVSVDGLTNILKTIYNNTDLKDVQSEIGNYIGQQLTMELESILKESSNSLKIDTEIEMLFDKWGAMTEYNTPFFYFNARFLFAKGVEKMPNIGALAAYTSIVKGINPITTPDNILSPFVITIGITTANDIGHILYRGSNEKWEEKLSKKVIDIVRTQNLWGKIERVIVDFWNNTERALINGSESLNYSTDLGIFNARYIQYDSKLQESVGEIQVSSIKNIVEILEGKD